MKYGVSGWSVPCGKCPECLKRARQDWFIRNMVEASLSDNVIFVTLTYRDSCLPREKYSDKPCVCKKDAQGFIHELRNIIYPCKIRYFLSSEYGDITHRPHYHCLLYNFPWRQFDPVETIKKAWPYGFVQCDQANAARISYVCRYTLAQHGYDFSEKRSVGFMLCSTKPAIGSAWLTPDRVRYYRESLKPVIHIDGVAYALPRYYHKHIYNTDELKALVSEKTQEYLTQLSEKTKQLEQLFEHIQPIDFVHEAIRRSTRFKLKHAKML